MRSQRGAGRRRTKEARKMNITLILLQIQRASIQEGVVEVGLLNSFDEQYLELERRLRLNS